MKTPYLKTQDVLIALIVDRSGSMLNRVTEVCQGINDFVTEQRKLDGKANISLTFFDDRTEQAVVDVPLDKFNKLDHSNYRPEGMTALYDAVGITLNSTYPNGRKVLVVIVTDGQENSSRLYNSAGVKRLIEQKQSEGWDFTYIGSGPGAWDQAKNIGIRVFDFAEYNADKAGSTQTAYLSATNAVSNVRLKGFKGKDWKDGIIK